MSSEAAGYLDTSWRKFANLCQIVTFFTFAHQITKISSNEKGNFYFKLKRSFNGSSAIYKL
jgi:hypothetical protein